MLAPSTIMIKGSEEDCHLTDTLRDNSEAETNDERVEQTQTVNQFFKTKRVLKPISQKSKTKMKGTQNVTYGCKEITNDKFYKELKEKEKNNKSKSNKNNSSITQKLFENDCQTSKKEQQKSKSKNDAPQTSYRDQMPGPLAIHVSDSNINSDSDYEEEIDESSKCCVCKKWQPDDIRNIYYVEFVKWAECSSCGHWTHLK